MTMTAQNEKTQVVTRNQEIIIGILSILAGIFIFVFNWLSALNNGTFRASMTIIAPICVAFGLCFLIFPYPQKEHFPKAEFAPKSWAFLIIPSFILGVINYLYLIGLF